MILFKNPCDDCKFGYKNQFECTEECIKEYECGDYSDMEEE